VHEIFFKIKQQSFLKNKIKNKKKSNKKKIGWHVGLSMLLNHKRSGLCVKPMKEAWPASQDFIYANSTAG
jgi:hypothetical protein